MTTTQYPLAICAILLIGEALIDLIIVRKLPQVDDILSTVQHEQRRTEDTGFSRITLQKPKQPINALTIQLATLYNEIWTFIAGTRFCFFFAVSLFIYTSGARTGSSVWEKNDDGQVKMGLEQIKSRVVFTFAFMEMMFWLWVRTFPPFTPYFVERICRLMWCIDTLECARRTTGGGFSPGSATSRRERAESQSLVERNRAMYIRYIKQSVW